MKILNIVLVILIIASHAAYSADAMLTGSSFSINADLDMGSKIQPGSWMISPNHCTLNYVFKNRYTKELAIGTAGHCTHVGDDVFMNILVSSENEVSALKRIKIGHTIFSTGNAGVGNDFALISIDTDKYDMVDPSIRLIDGPCGYSTDSIAGKQIVHFGHGLVIGSGGTFRFGVGSLFAVTSGSIFWHGTAIDGDSGSPVRISNTQSIGVDNTNAAAVGIQTHINIASGLVKGTSMEKVLEYIPEWDLVSSTSCK